MSQKKRSENFMRKQQEKIQQQQLNEDKMAADFYTTQNQLMREHRRYYRMIVGRRILWFFRLRGYEKWLNKVWEPYLRKRQEAQIELARKQAEGMKKVAEKGLPATNKDQ